MKRKSCLWLLGFCVLLMGGLAHAQYSMDLVVDYDGVTDSAIVKWYPSMPQDVTTYSVKGYAGDGTVRIEQTVASPQDIITLEGVVASGVATIEVTGFDASGVQIELSPAEEVASQNVPLPAPMAMTVQSSSTCGLGISFEMLDSGTFPMLYATVKVTDNGVPVGDYTVNEFEAYEDGVLQTDLFDVTPPDNNANVRIADIVFLIDTSGSMGGEIESVKNNCVAFANSLTASGIDYRLGLVQFGNSSGSNPRIVGGGLTADAETFKSWVSGLYASGSYEPGCGAINLAIQNYNFRPGSQKHFILITDEDSDSSCSDTINLITSNQIIVHCAANCGYGSSQAHYCGPGSVSDVSGGLVFPVTSNLQPVLDEIVAAIANTYIVRYKSSTPICDGTTRNVDIVVTDPNDPTCTATVSTSYTSCGAPIITRTPDTISLHDSSHTVGANLTIAAEVLDYVTPFVQGVTLFVRTTGTTNWTQIPMLPMGGDIYAVEIPVGLVNDPGVEYYIRATDGEVASTDPSSEPDTNPYQLAVLPNVAPVITHVPPANANVNTDCNLTIGAEDQTDGVAKVVLYHRITGELLWNEVVLTCDPIVPQVSDIFTITQDKIATPSIEYYIKAFDNYGVSSYWGTATADTPYVLDVLSTIKCALDIKPTSCPNPFNVTAKGVLPVAILGSESLDVTEIDVASLRLESVAPIRSSLEDVAAPIAEPNDCDCTDAGPDGFMDLTLKFYRQELVGVIGDVEHDDVRTLAIEGTTLNGTPIEGQDCIVIRGRHLGLGKADTNEDGIVDFLDFLTVSEKWLQKEILAKK